MLSTFFIVAALLIAAVLLAAVAALTGCYLHVLARVGALEAGRHAARPGLARCPGCGATDPEDFCCAYCFDRGGA